MASKPKYDFYQTETHVTVSILRRGLELDQCKVSYDDGRLTIFAKGDVIFDEELLYPIMADDVRLKCTSSKVEVTLAKVIGQHWDSLEKKKSSEEKAKKLINWDKLAKEVDEEDEKVEGDDSVNKLFQKIYADADDDTRRAMMKSYTESAGTVLSTNWNDIKRQKTDIKPPDGMEYKKW